LPPISLEEATIKPVSYPGPLQSVACNIRSYLLSYPKLLDFAVRTNRKMSALIQKKKSARRNDNALEMLYRENAKLRAIEHCKYMYAEICLQCNLYDICDGFHGDYAAIFGLDEAKPVIIGSKVSDPTYFISHQEKVVEREDHDWAL
jgi:hypothetical protein